MIRLWRDAVLDAVLRQSDAKRSDTVERQSLVAEELDRIIRETGSKGETPDQTLSKELGKLRDEGVLEFLRAGVYRILKRPFDVETSPKSDEELDDAIRNRLLRLGVDTGTAEGEARLRRGQRRVRELTLENYCTRCAVCDVQERGLLVASHIVPWADAPDARGDLANVVCLCRFHDALFELGYWSLKDNCGVVLRAEVRSRTIQNLLPPGMSFRRATAVRPDPRYLSQHRSRHATEFGWLEA